MIIALTGTPGTGKSSICSYLHTKFEIIDLNMYIKKEGLHFGQDEPGGSLIADMDAVQSRMDELLKNNTVTVIIEGHLSHYLKGTDAVIVLRTRPAILTQRLRARGYLPKKINENIEAEALDVILIESVERHQKVFEVETSTTTPKEASQVIHPLVLQLEAGNMVSLNKYLPGRFDWSEEVFL